MACCQIYMKITVSLINNDINILINLYTLTSIVRICENNFGSIIKLLSMIKTVSPNIKL